MESRAKVAGHPLHQMLVMFPLGLLPSALIFELIGFATDDPIWPTMAYYMIAAGIIGGAIAAVPGVIDWLAIPRGTRAKRIGLLHAIGNVVVLALFIASWLLRRDAIGAPPIEATVLAFVGVALAGVTGWLGGELVDRLGVGVDQDAHLDAPSSLTHAHVDPTGGRSAVRQTR
jgi:uncharacterized membrane protein